MPPDGRSDGRLSRRIGVCSATLLVVSNMLGTGIFTTSGLVMAELGDPLLLLACWLCGGLFALCGALCYAELGAKFPLAGGEYAYLRETFGQPMAFLSGWVSMIVGFSAPIAAASIAFATYLFAALGIDDIAGAAFALNDLSTIPFSPITITAVTAIVLLALLHYHSLETGIRFQNVLTTVTLFLLVLFICAGFLSGNGSGAHFRQVTAPGTISAEGFAISLVLVSFAYSGWNASAYLGGEIREPRKNIPRSLLAGTLLVTGLFLLLNAAYIYAMPVSRMQGVIDVGAQSARFLFGEPIGRGFAMTVAVAILASVSAMMATGPRIYLAMSRDGVFFSKPALVSPKRGTPAVAIAVQASISGGMVLTAGFEALLLYIGFTLSIFAILTVVGMMRIRRLRPEIASPFKTIGYPVTPMIFIAGNLWIIVYMIRCRPIHSLSGVATIVLGVLAYSFFAKHQNFAAPSSAACSSSRAE